VPSRSQLEAAALARCGEACLRCAAACAACAAACLAEKDLEHRRRCIRLAEDCSDLCLSTGRAILRTFEPDMSLFRAMLALCAWASELCAAECRAHAALPHCRACADACTVCQRECRAVLRALLGSHGWRASGQEM
jgi:hypothetical protein